jgi:hypothetical protein
MSMGAVERVARLRVARSRIVAAAGWVCAHAWLGGWWLAGRALVVAAALAVHVFGPVGWIRSVERAHALGALEAWDGHWYRMVASSGYLLVPGRQSDPAFFPLFPILLRAGHALGLGYSTAGMVIANLGLLGALASFYRLSRELLGEELARRATTYLAVFPFGYVFSMVYPESIVVALIALAALAALRGRWLWAAVCAALAALARPEGLFLALPLLVIAWQQRRDLTPLGRGVALGAVAAPLAALASFSLYLGHVVGDRGAWSEAQQAWGRNFSPLGFVHAIGGLDTAFTRDAWVVRDVVAALLYIALLVVAARARVPWPWLASGAAIVVLPLFSGSFDSIGRIGLLAPAPLWGLAVLGRVPRLHRLILGLSAPLLVAALVTSPLVFP